MTEAPDTAVVARLAAAIERVAGNVVPTGHYPFLGETLRLRAQACALAPPEYVDQLAAGRIAGEWERLLPLVTIKESYLFRSPQQFAALARLLPSLVAARAASRRLRVWSAGCARGEETATLALWLAEQPSLAGWDWQVLGTDVDDEALAAARHAVYGARAVSQVPAAILERRFTARGDRWQLAPELVARIEYRHLNLVSEPFALPPDPFDIILLRNVLIYFRPESQRRVVAQVARRLAVEGVLFVGPSESLFQLTDALRPIEVGEAFGYVHHASTIDADWPTRQGERRRDLRTGPPDRRRATPAGGGAEIAARPPRAAGDAPHASLAAVPASAGTTSAATITAPAAERPAPASALASLVALIDGGRLDDAEAAFVALAASHPSTPAVHALGGLAADLRDDPATAATRYRAALFLDPELVQVRLLLAEAKRRLGVLPAAAQHHREVLRAVAAGTAREVPELTALRVADAAGAARRSEDALRRLGSTH